MDANRMRRSRRQKNKFNGEMRVLVNRKMYPNMTSELLWELVERAIDNGKPEPGIIIKHFDVKGRDATEKVYSKEYAFVTAATSVNGAPVNKKS